MLCKTHSCTYLEDGETNGNIGGVVNTDIFLAQHDLYRLVVRFKDLELIVVVLR